MFIDFKKLIKSFKIAFFGLGYAIKKENTIRVGVIIAIAMMFIAFYFPLSAVERSIIILSIVVVMGTELLNTRIERILDIIDEEYNEKIKIIKDVSAGTTLLCVIGTGIIGVLILLSHI
jgi:diacylglycerol kinase (ATP)